MEENMISNEFSVKLCLEHEVKHGYKVVKKELIVALKQIYLCLWNETITIYLKPDTFLDSSGEEEKIGDDWDLLLDDLDFGDIPDIEGVEIP
ncbi:hypothetical protein Tco_1402672 [Tanacetum coccineum]